MLLLLCRDLRAKLELSLEKLLDACCNTEARKMPGMENGEEWELIMCNGLIKNRFHSLTSLSSL